MAFTWIVTRIDDEGEFLKAFGQLQFTAASLYTPGGDPNGTIVLDKGTAGVSGVTTNSAGLPVFLSGQTNIRATRSPFEFNIQLDIGTGSTVGAIGVIIPGTSALNFKIKLINANTGAEFGNSAYNSLAARLDNAVFHYLGMSFKKNL